MSRYVPVCLSACPPYFSGVPGFTWPRHIPLSPPAIDSLSSHSYAMLEPLSATVMYCRCNCRGSLAIPFMASQTQSGTVASGPALAW